MASLRSIRWLLVPVLCAGLFACGPGAVRLGPALPTATGPAQSACEREGWYEAAPARMQAQGTEAGVFFNTHYHQDFKGVALFRPGSSDPLPLEDAWPDLRQSKLQREHEARIEPVDAAHRHSLYWALGGLAGMAAGIGGAVAVADSNEGAAAVLGVSGLVAGVIGVVGALVAQPSGPEQLEADARRELFIEGEDDMSAVQRGVERSNGQARARCAGQ